MSLIQQYRFVNLILIVLITIGLSISLQFPALAINSNNGADIFEIHCASCHPNGNNIIRRGKNLKLRTLRRRKLDSVEAIAELVTQGKNNMSAYNDRLSPQEIQAVSAYVLQQAENNWHK